MMPENMTGFAFLKKVIEEEISHPMAKVLSLKLIEMEIGKVVFSGIPTKDYTNPLGTVHGGWYGSILDSAMACSIMSHLPPKKIFTTLEYKINMTAPIPLNKEIFAVGNSIHVGSRTAVAEGKIVDNDGVNYALGTTTCLIVSI